MFDKNPFERETWRKLLLTFIILLRTPLRARCKQTFSARAFVLVG